MSEFLKRFKNEVTQIAGGEVEVEKIGSAMYMFGTELETLRCLKEWKHCKGAHADYSENMKTFFFRLDVNI